MSASLRRKTTGSHYYNGRFNSRGKRKQSKICAGLKINYSKLDKAFEEIEEERRKNEAC
jgi:hypothetical protein